MRLAVDAAHTGDVSLERSTLTLTAEEPRRLVRVDVLEDDLAEPRETVAIRASAEGVAAAEALLAIPRNGYALKSLRIRGAMLAREDVQVEAELNAPAPTTASLRVDVERAVPDARQWTYAATPKLQIAPGRTTGSVTLSSLLWSGWYRAFLWWGPGFQGGAYGDQGDLLVESSRRLSFWLSPQQVTLWAELEEQILMEGGTMTWRVGMRTNVSREFLMDVDVLSDHPQDVEFREDWAWTWWRQSWLWVWGSEPLSLEIRALEDGLAEPRETVLIRVQEDRSYHAVTGVEVESAEVSLVIPRHGYAVTELRAPQETLPRQTFAVEAQLNAPAPVTAVVTVQVGALEGGVLQTEQMRIGTGAHSGSILLSAPQAGRYDVEVVQAVFVSAEAGDQSELRVLSETAQFEALGDWALQLNVLQDAVAEGETGRMEVRAFDLLSGEVLAVDLRVAEGAEEDVRLATERVELTAGTPTVQVEFFVLEDGLVEPGEEAVVRASAPGVREARDSVSIPRNGYTVVSVRAPSEAQVWDAVETEWELNAAAPAAVVLEVQAELLEEGVGAPSPVPGEMQTARLEIPAGKRVGRGLLALEEAGLYRLSLSGATFATTVAGEQRGLLEGVSSPSAQLRVGVRRVGLEVEISPDWVSEGQERVVRVRALNLPAGRSVTVGLSLSVADAGGAELSKSTGAVSAGSPAEFRVRALEDGVPEGREALALEAQALGWPQSVEAAPGTGVLWIARHGYEVAGFRMSPRELLSGEALEMEVELNAPASERVRWNAEARVVPDGDLQEVHAVIAMGARTGSSTFRLRPAGRYRVRLLDATFASWEPGDQQRLLSAGAEHPQIEVEVHPRLVRVELALEGAVLPEGGVTGLQLRVSGLSDGEELRVRLLSDAAGEVEFTPEELTLRGPQWSERALVRVLEDGAAELEEALRLSVELAGDAPLGAELEWGVAVLRVPGHGYAVERFEAPDSVEAGEAVRVRLELNTAAPATWEWSVEAQLLKEDGVDVPVPAPGVEPLRGALAVAAGERRGTATLHLQQRGLYEVSVRAMDTGSAEIGSLPSLPLRVHPRQLRLHLSLDHETLVEGRTATLTVSVEQALAEETVAAELGSASDAPLNVEFQPSRVELSAGARTATVSVRVLEDAEAPSRQWVQLEVRGVFSLLVNWVAPVERLGVELLRRVSPTAPALDGRALGPYQMWLSWTLSDHAGELLRERERYALLYAETSGGVCPAEAGTYRPAAEAASYTSALPSGWRAQVSGQFADGGAVQAQTVYCFAVEAHAGGGSVRTQPLQLRTLAYNPGMDRDADGLPDHLEALCGGLCAGLESPRGDADGDGVNNALEAYLRAVGAGAADGGDAYSDADRDGVPDIIELQFGGWIREQSLEVREMTCDAGAYLTRVSSCGESLEGMRLQIVMNSQGRGVYQGGAEGLSGSNAEVDVQGRLGSGTHWLLDGAGRAVRLQIRPLLSLRGSGAVVLGVEGTEEVVPASYVAEASLQGPLPRGAAELRLRVCRLAAAPDFVLAQSLELGLCDVREGEALALNMEARRHALKWEWSVSVAEDEGKRLRLRGELLEGAEWVSVHSFGEGMELPELGAELWFAPREAVETGVQQKLVPYLVDEAGVRAGSVGNGEAWRFKTEPVGRIEEVNLICAVGMRDGEERVERRFTDWSAADEEGMIVLDAGEAFDGRVVRAEFYASEAAECGARSGLGEGFLGELSFLVGEKDEDGNLVPDESEGGGSDVTQTGEKGLRYRLGRAAGEEEYYLRSRLSLRLGADAAEDALGTPNLVEGGEALGVPRDSLQALDGVVLDFETFCAADPECLRAGETVQLVFEMRSAIPEDAEYYKLRETEAEAPLWCPLVVQYEGVAPLAPEGCPQAEGYQGRDGMSFAAHGESGECPEPGSDAYRATGARGAPYLDAPQTGERCVQLTLTDNGPNDDNPLSGVVADPIGIFERVVRTPQQTAQMRSAQGSDSGGGGGGGGGGGAAGWPLALLLAALLGLSLHRRRLLRN